MNTQSAYYITTMKIFERIVDYYLCDVVRVSTNQCIIIKGLITMDAIHRAYLLVEKHREKNQPLHLAFLDLEKVFVRVLWDTWKHFKTTVSQKPMCDRLRSFTIMSQV